ncbi:hypothetical protein OESDEN_18719 [Oesophagostomum dentatum]|uniref:Uncharacterized protein n=1 Tax=Oesophagostomum dentatum TaxID=61180 RepID=A0A0B1S9K0_OESDE|nr:hypothetical protein OESDEN_18719 [Oesophagostomum dentatum]
MKWHNESALGYFQQSLFMLTVVMLTSSHSSNHIQSLISSVVSLLSIIPLSTNSRLALFFVTQRRHCGQVVILLELCPMLSE